MGKCIASADVCLTADMPTTNTIGYFQAMTVGDSIHLDWVESERGIDEDRVDEWLDRLDEEGKQ